MNHGSYEISPVRGAHIWIYKLAVFAWAASACTNEPATGGTGGSPASSGGRSGAGSGGAAHSGGATGSGGASSSGGTSGSGGASSSGGASGSGGASSSGGASGANGSGGTGLGGRGAGGSGGVGGKGSGGAGGGNGVGSGGTAGSKGASCGGKAYKFCDDFEAGGPVGGIPTGWTALKGYGPAEGVGLANDDAHSGSLSVKTSTMATGAQRIQMSLASLGTVATNHWGRLYYKVKTPAPVAADKTAYYHITFAALQLSGTPAENRVVDTVESPAGKIQYIYNLPDDSCCPGSDYSWTHDGAWHCAEWYVDVSKKSYRFFVDTKEVTSIGFTGKDAAKMGNYTALGLGAIFYVTPNGPLRRST